MEAQYNDTQVCEATFIVYEDGKPKSIAFPLL